MRDLGITPTHQSKYQKSIHDFRIARQRAAMEAVIGRLTGKSDGLLSYHDVADKLKIVNQSGRGVRDIPVDAIVGSVGRYTDFSRTFLPKLESDATRWARVASVPNFHQLPPIEVYQIGDVYFVLDGNHRVSIARQRGIHFIPAAVTEVRTRAPLPPDVSPDKLILQAEFVNFLENTNLDRLRPDADLLVSVPGQYRKLENHMEVHRFFIEMAEEIELSDDEAVTRWYEEAYLPVVQAVREQGVLRGFPNRTETDLYLWISEHQAHLRNELGWQVRAEVATADLVDRAGQKAENKIARLGKKFSRGVLNLVLLRESKSQGQSWSQFKLAARYSDRLFADLLVVLSNDSRNQATLNQALLIAGREDSRLHGLCLTPGDQAGEASATTHDFQDSPTADLRAWFSEQCRAAGIEGRLAFQAGSPVETICNRSALADLIVYGRPNDNTEENQQLLALIRRSPRPVLISTNAPVPLGKVLLAYDGSPKSREALFAATYMAERWGVSLTVVLAPKEENAEETTISHARRYLEMHEVEAAFVVCDSEPADLILETAAENKVQLIIAGGYEERSRGRTGSGAVVQRLVAEWSGALLICP
jgi:nucleotide-binding universal stress UspA family protein